CQNHQPCCVAVLSVLPELPRLTARFLRLNSGCFGFPILWLFRCDRYLFPCLKIRESAGLSFADHIDRRVHVIDVLFLLSGQPLGHELVGTDRHNSPPMGMSNDSVIRREHGRACAQHEQKQRVSKGELSSMHLFSPCTLLENSYWKCGVPL